MYELHVGNSGQADATICLRIICDPRRCDTLPVISYCMCFPQSCLQSKTQVEFTGITLLCEESCVVPHVAL